MDPDIRIDYVDKPSIDATNVLGQGLAQEAYQQKGFAPAKPFAFFAYTLKDEQIGGLNGYIYYGCLHIDQLYIQPAYRSLKLGTQLMLDAELLAKHHDCTMSTVMTMDWEACDFYLKLGYQIEFKRTGYQGESSMYLLRKDF